MRSTNDTIEVDRYVYTPFPVTEAMEDSLYPLEKQECEKYTVYWCFDTVLIQTKEGEWFGLELGCQHKADLVYRITVRELSKSRPTTKRTPSPMRRPGRVHQSLRPKILRTLEWLREMHSSLFPYKEGGLPRIALMDIGKYPKYRLPCYWRRFYVITEHEILCVKHYPSGMDVKSYAKTKARLEFVESLIDCSSEESLTPVQEWEQVIPHVFSTEIIV